MSSPWEIYDDLIAEIPEDLTVKYYQGGFNWSRVISSEDNMGIAMTIPIITRDAISNEESLIGKKIRDVACLVKSWNLVEAAIGLSAINSWYNHPLRIEKCGREHPDVSVDVSDAFEVYSNEIKGKKVAVVGHFPFIETRFKGHCDIAILERNPSLGDYIDSACEYILPEQDYVFATACTLVNKTFPRLLELSKNAKFILVGPSTPLTSILYDHGVYGLSGLIVEDNEKMEHVLSGATNMTFKAAGKMTDFMKI